jgi:peroxiredoxin Q/BCP
MPEVGDPIPDVTLTSASGPVRVRDLIGQRALVLYFYPKDETPGCTAQACAFRDRYQDFVDAGADVVGVSADDAASHDGFKRHHNLPFTLLSDPGGAGARAFGVKKTLGLIAGRVTFVIDRGGIIRLRWDSQLKATKHIGEALAVGQAAGVGLSRRPGAAHGVVIAAIDQRVSVPVSARALSLTVSVQSPASGVPASAAASTVTSRSSS